jgi:hypothetical protein
MKIFGLNPSQVLERSGTEKIKSPYSLTFSILYGGIGFGLVSVIAYSIWAFRLIRGQWTMYAAIALVYLLLSGWVLGRLTIAPKNQIRFTALFSVAFLGYAVLWCLFWFGFKWQNHRDLYGSVLGLLLMAIILKRAFGCQRNLLFVFGILFTFHTLGYYAGDDLHQITGGSTGRLLWGACHGIGFGAGLGCLIHQCQLPLIEASESTD